MSHSDPGELSMPNKTSGRLSPIDPMHDMSDLRIKLRCNYVKEDFVQQHSVSDIGAFEPDIDDEDDDDVGKFVIPRVKKTKKSAHR